MFLINSCSHQFSATANRLQRIAFTISGVPSPEVTVPFCLVPSPEFSQAPWYPLPDHLCRFGVRLFIIYSLEAFPGSRASMTSIPWNLVSCLRIVKPDLPNLTPYTLSHGLPTPCSSSLLRPPIAIIKSTGILTRFPSTTLFSLALGADLPYPD